MTRTVEMARRWPMPVKYTATSSKDYRLGIALGRRWVADATPVRVFEGEV